MAGKSWQYAGETKDWDNFWEHKFIRDTLVTGWSAQEGGPGASSHLREERTDTYLRRPCGKHRLVRTCIAVCVERVGRSALVRTSIAVCVERV